jgi:hypothetical protein
MKIVLECILCATLMFAEQTPSSPDISVQPNLIDAGQTANLTWSVSGTSQQFYILGVGKVESNGIRKVSPRHTSVYTIIAQGPNGITSKSATLQVKGSRGADDDCSRDSERFKYEISFDRRARSLVEEINSLHRLLQDEMQFAIDESQAPLTASFTFLTNCSQRGDLVQTSEKQIGARRLSYRVVLLLSSDNPQPHVNSAEAPGLLTLHYKIGTLIEYRRKVESTWRLESREELYRQAARDLKRHIENTPAR